MSEWLHWGRVTHICVSKLTIIGSDNGLSPEQRQAIIWTNAGMLLIGALGTNFSEISIEIHQFFYSSKCIRICLQICGHFVWERWVNNNWNINMIKALHDGPIIRTIHQWPQCIHKVFPSHDLIMFSFTKMCLKVLSAKCCSFRLGLNVLTTFLQHGTSRSK